MRLIDIHIDFAVFSILSSLSLAEDLLAQVKCESHPLGYIVPDPTYCDRYLLCKPGGERETRVCDQGQKFDFNTAGCALDSVVICGDRTKTWRDKRDMKLENFENDIMDHFKNNIIRSPYVVTLLVFLSIAAFGIFLYFIFTCTGCLEVKGERQKNMPLSFKNYAWAFVNQSKIKNNIAKQKIKALREQNDRISGAINIMIARLDELEIEAFDYKIMHD